MKYMVDQKQIIEAIADSLTLPVTDVDPEASLQDDLGLNPVAVADLIHDLTDRFHVIFEAEETMQLKTVSDLIEMVEDKLLE